MKEKEHLSQIQSIFNLATQARQLNIATTLEAMRFAESVGAIIDPTLYLKAALPIELQIRIAEAALQFQQRVEQIASDPRYAPIGKKLP